MPLPSRLTLLCTAQKGTFIITRKMLVMLVAVVMERSSQLDKIMPYEQPTNNGGAKLKVNSAYRPTDPLF